MYKDYLYITLFIRLFFLSVKEIMLWILIYISTHAMRIIFNKEVITQMRLKVATPEPYSSVLYV